MKTDKEIKDKVTDLLNKNNIALPTHELDSEKGISRLLLYYNKHSTDDMKKEMQTFLNTK
jgi:hypothetical protein